MMTLTYAALALSPFFLWWRKASWGWVAVLIALGLGIVIFAGRRLLAEPWDQAMKEPILTPEAARVLNFVGLMALLGVLLGAYVYQFSTASCPARCVSSSVSPSSGSPSAPR
jgi:hypothetical protein